MIKDSNESGAHRSPYVIAVRRVTTCDPVTETQRSETAGSAWVSRHGLLLGATSVPFGSTASCREAFRGSQDPLRSFQCRQQSIVSARDDVSTPTEGHNGCGKRASRLFQPTCTSVQEHDHKQMGTQSCPSEYARSLPTESPRLRERSKTLASSQKAPFARAPLWMQSMSTARPTHPGTCTMRFVPDRTRTADEVTPNSATLADLQLAAKHSMRGAGSSRLAPAIRRVGRFVSGEHFSASEQELVSRNAQYRLSDPPPGRLHRVSHRYFGGGAAILGSARWFRTWCT